LGQGLKGVLKKCFGVRHAKGRCLPYEWQAGAYGGKACRSEAKIPLRGAFAIFQNPLQPSFSTRNFAFLF
jgi:hypothetical protein